MDDYVNHLSLGSSAEDVLDPCAKLLQWMSITCKQDYGSKSIETIIKASVFLHECITHYGNGIVDGLVEQEPFLRAYFERCLNDFKNLNCISTLNENILLSSNTLKNAVILDNILKNLKDIYSEYISVRSRTHLSLDINRSQMNFLANSLFQLPTSQIDAAFDKVCNEIGFEILGNIFCADINDCMFIKYAILEEKLCNKIINLNSNSVKYFIRSIIRYIAEANKGQTFYKKCLESSKFLESLCEFFKKFLHSLKYPHNNEIFQFLTQSEIFYLLSITVKLKPSEVLSNIENTNINIDLSSMLTQLWILFQS
uniref:Uncharacterized protein n=1 Tax=Glossina morsitans morsitans TaxID=37546 RepID=A0ABK9NG40_GLOMM